MFPLPINKFTRRWTRNYPTQRSQTGAALNLLPRIRDGPKYSSTKRGNCVLKKKMSWPKRSSPYILVCLETCFSSLLYPLRNVIPVLHMAPQAVIVRGDAQASSVLHAIENMRNPKEFTTFYNSHTGPQSEIKLGPMRSATRCKRSQ